MNIGIFTYGTRGDLQPYVALALGLMEKGHKVTISATEDFKSFVEGFGVKFEPLWGNAETMMNSEEGQSVLQTENSIKLMKYYFKVLHNNRVLLRKSYFDAISKVDFIIANSMTLPIVSTIAEKQNKKVALTYFMPPVVPTSEFPLGDFDFFNFSWYNKLTYKIAQGFFWKFVKHDTNEYRRELGLPELKENLVTYLDKQKILDLYCLSQSLVPQPQDWESHHKITGFINIPKQKRESHFLDRTTRELSEWLSSGSKPIYIGFGSNGVGNTEKISKILAEIIAQTDERILFCTGWSRLDNLPMHKNLFITKYVNHETILPQCKLGIFHGGAGTLATMLRLNLPVIIVSFYTDQPTWGKIVARKKLGFHIPIKSLSANKLISSIQKVQADEIGKNVSVVGQQIRDENGLDNAINEIEKYFNDKQNTGHKGSLATQRLNCCDEPFQAVRQIWYLTNKCGLAVKFISSLKRGGEIPLERNDVGMLQASPIADITMKQILTIIFCALTVLTYGQKNKNKGPNFDIADFNQKFEVAEWLYKYDLIAWWTSDSVMVQDKKEIERLGKEWFCYQDQNNIWHAVYGKYDNGTFDLVFHFTVDNHSNVKRTYDKIDTLILNSYSRALITANKQVSALKDTVNIHFNQYVKQNNDQTFSVWILPAFQTNGTAVYGGEFIYTIDQTGNKILKDDSYFQGVFRGFKVDELREIWLNYRDTDKPTLGAVFFVWYYKQYFTNIYIDCSRSNSTVLKGSDNQYTWVHAEREPEKKKRDQ